MIQAKQRQLMSIELQKLKNNIRSFSHWFIFPFQINSGAIGNSETGYKPLNAKVTDYGDYELIFTGDSPVICIWQGSTRIYQKNKGITDPNTKKTTGQDQFYTKQYNLETAQKWQSYLIEDISSVNFGNLSSNTLFTTLSIGRTYTLISFDEQIKVNDYLQFFVVLNDNDTNIAGGTTNEQDRQLLYLSNVTNKYDPYTNKFFCQVITLSSVNDRASSSGMTVQSFIQYGGAGSGYAFPQFINKKLNFNKDLMRDIGVRYVHRQSYGLEALTSIYYYGRPIIQGQRPVQIENNKEIYEQKVFASRRLLIGGDNEYSTTDVKNNGGLYAGINDLVTTNSHPETTFYNIMDAKPTGFLNYADWQEFLAAKQFNMLAEKSFKGILAFDADKAKNSNGTDIGEAKMFWDSEWIIKNLTGNYNIEMSSNFRYKDPDTNKVIGSSTVDYSKIKQKWMSSVLNFNSLIFSPLVQMPYDSNQWLPFAWSQIPLIGKFLNALSLGIPVGWILTQNYQQYKKMLFFNTFMSAFFTSALDKIFGKEGLIPLNVFSTQNDMELGQMLGSKVSTTALLMKLTDRISVFPWDPEKGTRLETKEQISTVDISQKKNNKIYIFDEETEFLDITSTLTNLDTETQWNPTPNGIAEGDNYAYIIDYIVTQSLHQGEERHTFFSDNPFTYNGDFNEISVSQVKFRNQSSLTNNLFNWMTQYKMNHDEYSETEETSFDYPKSILPPDPLDIAKPIELIPTVNYYSSGPLPFKNLFTQNGWNLTYNKDYWVNNIKDKIKHLEINFNLKDYLNPKLLINTFNDLRRFYKSITIYIEWDYKINVYNDQTTTLANFPMTKTITEARSFAKEINLNDINYYTNNKENDFNIKEQSNIYEGDLYMGPSTPRRHYIYGTNYINFNNNVTNNLYILDNFKYDGYWYYGQNETNGAAIKFNFNNYLSLGLKVKEDNPLDWTFQFFPVYFYFILDIVDQLKNNYRAFNTDSYTIKLTRVVLNPR